MYFNFQNMAALCDANAEQSKFWFSRSRGDARYLVIPCTASRNYDTYNFNQSLFNDLVRELKALAGLTLRPGQVEALQSLTEGKDVLLVAKTGETLIFTGYNFLIPSTIEAVTLIITFGTA